jgi:hypothetical protein
MAAADGGPSRQAKEPFRGTPPAARPEEYAVITPGSDRAAFKAKKKIKARPTSAWPSALRPLRRMRRSSQTCGQELLCKVVVDDGAETGDGVDAVGHSVADLPGKARSLAQAELTAPAQASDEQLRVTVKAQELPAAERNRGGCPRPPPCEGGGRTAEAGEGEAEAGGGKRRPAAAAATAAESLGPGPPAKRAGPPALARHAAQMTGAGRRRRTENRAAAAARRSSGLRAGRPEQKTPPSRRRQRPCRPRPQYHLPRPWSAQT